MTDKDRLDYLDQLEAADRSGHGEPGWQLRESSTGRGWRLLTTGREPNYPTAREAIDAAYVSGPVKIS